MNDKSYYIINNEFTKEEFSYTAFNNRAFKYGDALFESIHAYGTEPQFLNDHLKRLYTGMNQLKMEIPAELTQDSIHKQIGRLLNKNRIFGGARIRLTVFRDAEGLYAPLSNKTKYVIFSGRLEKDKYELNSKGLIIDIYPDIKKPVNMISNLKTTNSLLFVLAGIYKNEQRLDDCLILNEKGRITETISSNLFLVKNDKIYTPSLSEGCLAGVMRNIIIELLRNMNYRINGHCSLTANDLESADEIFLTNAIEGIKWVLGFKNKRYYNKISKSLIEKLNIHAYYV